MPTPGTRLGGGPVGLVVFANLDAEGVDDAGHGSAAGAEEHFRTRPEAYRTRGCRKDG